LFIVLEGIDGAGTTTQCQLLAQSITALGHPSIRTREPGGTPLAEAIRALILDPNQAEITDLAELLLYAASRAQHVNEKIRPALAQGIHVVCDRFTASTWAYQGYGRGLNLRLIAQVTAIAADYCKPDLTLYLRVPREVAMRRRQQREQHPDRLELAGDNFQDRVARGYEKLAHEDPHGAAVDGDQPPEEVAGEIWRLLIARWPHFPAPTRTAS